MKDRNATQAAIRANYSAKTGRQIGSKLLSKVDIAAEISIRYGLVTDDKPYGTHSLAQAHPSRSARSSRLAAERSTGTPAELSPLRRPCSFGRAMNAVWSPAAAAAVSAKNPIESVALCVMRGYSNLTQQAAANLICGGGD